MNETISNLEIGDIIQILSSFNEVGVVTIEEVDNNLVGIKVLDGRGTVKISKIVKFINNADFEVLEAYYISRDGHFKQNMIRACFRMIARHT